MRNICKKTVSWLLAVMILLSVTAVGVMAESAAPAAVKSCTVEGYFPEVMYLEFEDTVWLNAVSGVKVNGTAYEKQASFGFGASEAWRVNEGKLELVSAGTYPAEIEISAAGYNTLKLEVKKNASVYPYVYTAEVKSDAAEATPTPAPTAAPTATPTAAPTAAPTATPTPVPAPTEDKDPPEAFTVSAYFGYDFRFIFTDAASWLNAITDVQVDGVSWEKAAYSSSVYNNKKFYANAGGNQLFIGEDFAQDTASCVITANGYKPLTLTLDKTKHTATVVPNVEPLKTVDINNVSLTSDMFGNDWNIAFAKPEGYVKSVTDVKVNGTSWEEKTFKPSTGGAYYKNTDENTIVTAQKSYSSDESKRALQSGDVITVSAEGYEDLTMKFVVDTDGSASLVADDGEGDPYELHVKIEGTFEAAIVGQKDYDGVSGASTGASSNNNSAVTVYGAMTAKGEEPSDEDWQELDNYSKVNLNGSKCKVSIVPDTENGTPADADSGMEGVYFVISSKLSLSGTPKDAGRYLISVSVEDVQGRKAESNTLPFVVYTGEETLADQIKLENLKKYESGKYAWDIMEPWSIHNFGSNVDGEEESVRVPADLEVWFGSHESGTYGYLGYDLPWEDVEAGNIPQTLYIPNGCDLTLTNMEVLSSVRIVVENGGKLTLSDSVVQGIIDVQAGGTFSMNYDAYNNTFTTGASVCGQIRLADGAALENAAIYSHANYLANGNLADRTTYAPVVSTAGNVTVRGQVFIEGDSAADTKGQTALRVSNGTLTLEDGATLVAYGGDGKVIFNLTGGTAVELENGTIAGSGKLVAIGGDVLFGNGGTAVSGTGTISANEVFLQGATAYTSQNAKPGKATDGDITLTSANRHVKDGTLEETGKDDPLTDLYWKTGIDAVPPLDLFTTEPYDPSSEIEDGLQKIDGVWGYYKDGEIDTAYTGAASYNGGLFYVTNGLLDWNYTGLVKYNNAWLYFTNGRFDGAFNGAVRYNGGIYYITNGVLNWSYTGLVKFENAWIYITNSRFDGAFNGAVEYNGGIYYVTNGVLNWSYTGMAEYNGTTYYMVNSSRSYHNGTVTVNGVRYTVANGIVKK